MKFKKKTLKNGLRILLVPKKETKSVLAMVLVRTGTNYEEKIENGLSHFLEHMCFKGTEKRPSVKQISTEFDNIGADINAFTHHAYTGYFARAHQKHASTILEMVSDIYLNPLFPEAEIEKEKGVVIQEINMYMDDPQYRVHRLSTGQLYGDQPVGWETLGTKESVSSFTRADLKKYYAKHYSPKNTLVIISGNFKEKQIEKEIAKLFGGMKARSVSKIPKQTAVQSKPNIAVEFKETDQTHLILSFRAFGYKDKRLPAAGLLSDAFGSGMSSRLFLKMREELGICYYANSGMSTHEQVGTFNISAGVSNERIDEALNGLVDEIIKLRDGGITEEELKKVKEGRLSSLVIHLETSEDFAYFYGRSEILRGKIRTPDERAREIEAVKRKQVNDLAKLFLTQKGLNLAIVGPYKEEDKARFAKILSRI